MAGQSEADPTGRKSARARRRSLRNRPNRHGAGRHKDGMSLRFSLAGGALCALLCVSCGGDNKPSRVTEADVVRQYALNLRANYQDVVARLEDLQSAV